MNQNLDELNQFIVDGEALLNNWNKLLENFSDSILFVSLNNFLYSKKLLETTFELLKDKPDILQDYIQKNQQIIEFLNDTTINDEIQEFSTDEHTYSTTYVINPKQNLNIIIYKGFKVESNIEPVIEEVIAYSYFRKTKSKEIPILAKAEELIAFINETKLPLKYEDLRF